MRSVLPLAALAVVALAVLPACGGSSPGTSSGGGHRVVEVSFTDDGCQPRRLRLPAGPTTFHVSNDGASHVTEYELLDGTRILGEVENLADGFDGSFTLTLEPGTYTLSCPGAAHERGTLTVGGGTEVAATEAARRAVARYRAYLQAQTALLVARVRRFEAAIDRGDLAGARRLYPVAREPYERVEPVAESFGDLDPLLDARAGDVPAARWEGFHRLERLLWAGGTLQGAKPLAKRLLANTLRLQRLVRSVPLQPAQIANGAKGLLDEVAASKITGEEDRYSHTDLWDFQANVDGAAAAFRAVRPLLERADPELARTVERRFRDVAIALAAHRRGPGFVLYTALTKAQTRRLARSIDALAEPISQVAPKIVG